MPSSASRTVRRQLHTPTSTISSERSVIGPIRRDGSFDRCPTHCGSHTVLVMSSVSYRHFTGRSAENYQRDFVPLIATPVSKTLVRAADLQPGEHVLDVACGTGHVTRAAAERVGSTGTVVGIDIAPDMIEVAKSVRVPGGARVDWHIADAAALPIPDASVDVVLCQMGLMFMENKAGAVAEMRRVLAPTGRIVINTPGPIPRFFELLERATRRAHQPRSRRLCQRGVLHARSRRRRRASSRGRTP